MHTSGIARFANGMNHQPTAQPGRVLSPAYPRAHRLAVAWCCQISQTMMTAHDTVPGIQAMRGSAVPVQYDGSNCPGRDVGVWSTNVPVRRIDETHASTTSESPPTAASST